MIRCAECHYQTSRFSGTPLNHLKLPYWVFGYVLEETFARYPQVMTSAELKRRLGISYNAAALLKRRVQLFACQNMEGVKKLMREELRAKFKGFEFPRDPEADLSKLTKKHAIPQTDTMVLFSASQRANKGRARYRHGGQTASIYMSENLGGKQVGTLASLISWKGGPLAVEAIPDQTMATLKPILDEILSRHTPVFTDEGYRFLYRANRNHRMVNHSARSKDNRWKWARDRWSRNGVHSQVAEGNGRVLKQAMKSYGWFRPENAPYYLSEFAFAKSAKYFGLKAIARAVRAIKREERASSSPLSVTNIRGGRRGLPDHTGVAAAVSRSSVSTSSVKRQTSSPSVGTVLNGRGGARGVKDEGAALSRHPRRGRDHHRAGAAPDEATLGVGAYPGHLCGFGIRDR